MARVHNWQLGRDMNYPYAAAYPTRQFAFVFNINRCIACQSCTMACKSTWTFSKSQEQMWWANVETKPYGGYPMFWDMKILELLDRANPLYPQFGTEPNGYYIPPRWVPRPYLRQMFGPGVDQAIERYENPDRELTAVLQLFRRSNRIIFGYKVVDGPKVMHACRPGELCRVRPGGEPGTSRSAPRNVRCDLHAGGGRGCARGAHERVFPRVRMTGSRPRGSESWGRPISSGVQGGLKVSVTSTCSTPGSAITGMRKKSAHRTTPSSPIWFASAGRSAAVCRHTVVLI